MPGPGNRSHLYGGKRTDVTCFHMQNKVVVIPGDLHKPGLGLSEEDEARIVNEVQFVVHSAASISFFEHIHTLLEQNYEVGLRALCTDCVTMGMCEACVAVEVADRLLHTVSMHITVLQCACLSAGLSVWHTQLPNNTCARMRAADEGGSAHADHVGPLVAACASSEH